MEFLIYGKDNCKYCIMAKALLTTKGYKFQYMNLGDDFTREDLLSLAPTAKTFPQIWLTNENRHIGTYEELEMFLANA